MKAEVYKLLLDVNASFEAVNLALAALRKYPAFHSGELDRLAALSHEARAAISSYLAGVVEAAETAEAGRRFGKRIRREKREEQA